MAEPAQPEISIRQFIPLIVMMIWNKMGVNTDDKTVDGALHVFYIRCCFLSMVVVSCLLCGSRPLSTAPSFVNSVCYLSLLLMIYCLSYLNIDMHTAMSLFPQSWRIQTWKSWQRSHNFVSTILLALYCYIVDNVHGMSWQGSLKFSFTPLNC